MYVLNLAHSAFIPLSLWRACGVVSVPSCVWGWLVFFLNFILCWYTSASTSHFLAWFCLCWVCVASFCLLPYSYSVITNLLTLSSSTYWAIMLLLPVDAKINIQAERWRRRVQTCYYIRCEGIWQAGYVITWYLLPSKAPPRPRSRPTTTGRAVWVDWLFMSRGDHRLRVWIRIFTVAVIIMQYLCN